MNTELLERLRSRLWEREPASDNERQLLSIGRFVAVLGRDLMDGQLSMRAMSLVYTTLLSLAPVLALGFSLFKALGIHNALEPALLQVLAPLGDQRFEITRNVIGFVENINVGLLGSVGVALLLYTVISTVQKIEASFNYVWRIVTPRGLGQRFGEYLSVLMVGPLVVFLAVGMTATVTNSSAMTWLTGYEPFGALVYIVGKLLPYVLIIGVFTFLYVFIPNTRVRFRAALAGGILGGVLWQTGSVVFAKVVAWSTGTNAIYSGFAILIFLLMWLYLGWLILLIGCQLSYYVQHPERLTPTRVAPHLSSRVTELLALHVVGLVGQRFLKGEPPVTLEDLRRSLPAPLEHVDGVVEILLHNGVLVEAGGEHRQLLPARDLGALSLAELWRRVRRGFDADGTLRSRGELAGRAEQLLQEVERGFEGAAGRRSVRDWLGTP